MTEEKSTAMSQLRGELVGRTIGPGLHILPGQGNAFAIETAAGVFLVDAGSRATAPRMLLVDGPRRVELIHVPSEVDDAIAVWLPDDGMLYGGAATPGDTIPNIGSSSARFDSRSAGPRRSNGSPRWAPTHS